MNRLKQPSTWAGIGLVITQAANAWAVRDWVSLAGVLAGLVAIIRNEAGVASG